MGLGALAGYTTSIEKSLMRKEIYATFDQVTAVWWSLSNASVITLQPLLLIITTHPSCQRRQRTLLSRECVYVCANKVGSKREIKLNIIIWAQVKMRCLTKLFFFFGIWLCVLFIWFMANFWKCPTFNNQYNSINTLNLYNQYAIDYIEITAVRRRQWLKGQKMSPKYKTPFAHEC